MRNLKSFIRAKKPIWNCGNNKCLLLSARRDYEETGICNCSTGGDIPVKKKYPETQEGYVTLVREYATEKGLQPEIIEALLAQIDKDVCTGVEEMGGSYPNGVSIVKDYNIGHTFEKWAEEKGYHLAEGDVLPELEMNQYLLPGLIENIRHITDDNMSYITEFLMSHFFMSIKGFVVDTSINNIGGGLPITSNPPIERFTPLWTVEFENDKLYLDSDWVIRGNGENFGYCYVTIKDSCTEEIYDEFNVLYFPVSEMIEYGEKLIDDSECIPNAYKTEMKEYINDIYTGTPPITSHYYNAIKDGFTFDKFLIDLGIPSSSVDTSMTCEEMATNTEIMEYYVSYSGLIDVKYLGLNETGDYLNFSLMNAYADVLSARYSS